MFLCGSFGDSFQFVFGSCHRDRLQRDLCSAKIAEFKDVSLSWGLGSFIWYPDAFYYWCVMAISARRVHAKLGLSQ